MSRAIVTIVAALCIGCLTALAAPIYWAGDQNANWNTLADGTNSNWSTAAGSNVEYGSLPQTADDVTLYMTGAGNLATVLGQDFTVNSLTFAASNAAASSVSGNTLSLAGSGAVLTFATGQGSTVASNLALTSASASSIVKSAGTGTLVVSGALNTGSVERTFTVNDSPGWVAELTVGGKLSGSGGIRMDNAAYADWGTLLLTNNANDYTGATTIAKGIVVITEANALGAVGAGNGTTIGTQGSLGLGGNFPGGYTVAGGAITVAEPITIAHGAYSGNYKFAIQNWNGANTLTGGITLASEGVIEVNTGTSLTVASAIAQSGGAQNLTKTGGGTLTFTGGNSYTGTTTVNGGVLALNANNIIQGPLVINAGATVTQGGGDRIIDNQPVTITGGTWNLQGQIEYIAPLTLSSNAQVVSTASGFLITNGLGGSKIVGAGTGNAGTISAPVAICSMWGNFGAQTGSRTQEVEVASGATLTISGAIFDSGAGAYVGALRKTGAGTLVLSGTNTYSNGTTIDAGTLSVSSNANLGSTGAAANLAINGATLQIAGSTAFSSARNVTFGATGGTIEVTNSAGATFSGDVGGGGGSCIVNKQGSGLLTLTGATTLNNTHLYVRNGELAVEAGASLTVGGTWQNVAWGTGDNATLTVRGTYVNNNDLNLTDGYGDSRGTLNISGAGSVTTNAFFVGKNGNANTLGFVNQSGGSLTAAAVYLSTGAGSGTYNLDGGTLNANSIGRYGGSTGTATFNFNGGTLKPRAANAAFLQGLTSAVVKAGGAIIDTSGFDVTIAQPLVAGSPSGGLTKSGNGTLTLTGVNTYTGGTIVNGGVLAIGGATSTIGGAVTVNAGGTLRLDGPNVLGTGTAITLNGGTFNTQTHRDYFGSLTMSNNAQVTGTGWFILNDPSGDITTTGTGSAGTIAAPIAIASQYGTSFGPRTQNFHIAPNTTLTVSGAIANVYEGSNQTGSLRKSGGGELVLTGINTYTGLTTVEGGTLRLLPSAANQSGTYTGGFVVNNGATLALARQDIWTNAAGYPAQVITVNQGGTVTSNGFFNMLNNPVLNGGTLLANGGNSSSWGAFGLEGTVTVGGAATSTIATNGAGSHNFIDLGNQNNAADTTFQVADANPAGPDLVVSVPLVNSGNAAGARGLVKTGAGTMVLSAANTYTGTTALNAGTLRVDGSLAGPVTVAANAILGGTGEINNTVTAALGGHVAPGDSAGTLTTGDLILSAGSILDIELSPAAWDSVNVEGLVTLDGAVLNVIKTGSFSLVQGSTYTILNNDLSDLIGGRFANLPEGASFELGGSQFQITYFGGTGNDVVLTSVPEPASLGLLALASGALGGYLRRRRTK